MSATALGYYSTIEKNSTGSIALGEGAKIAENSPTAIALGKHAYAGAENAIAIGMNASNSKKDAAFLKSRNTNIGSSMGASNVTLEIIGERDSTNKADGILIPIVTRGQLNAKNSQYTEPQFGTLVFVNYVGDGPAEGKTEDVQTYGFYYYDYWNTKGQRWSKLTDISTRSSSVEVGTGKYYTTLQEAYNGEAKKIYNQNGAPLEFICSGEVGGLDTDGSIPFITITSDGTMTSSDKGLTFNSTIARLNGKITVNNNITAYGSNLVVMANAEISAKELSIDNSSFKAFFGGNNLTFEALTCYNGFIDIEGNNSANSTLTLTGSSNIEYLISATNGGYILFANNLNILCNSTSAQYSSIMSSKTSTIYFNAVQQISFNGTYATDQPSYDIYASTISNIIFDECKNIGGTSTPSIVIAGSHKSNIINYQSTINKNTSGNGISLVSGSSMSIIGDRSLISLKGVGSTGSIGIVSSGSNVNVSSISASSPMVTLENFDIGIQATDGGIINAMKRIKRDVNVNKPNIPLTIATPSQTGAVVYDSDVE